MKKQLPVSDEDRVRELAEQHGYRLWNKHEYSLVQMYPQSACGFERTETRTSNLAGIERLLKFGIAFNEHAKEEADAKKRKAKRGGRSLIVRSRDGKRRLRVRSRKAKARDQSKRA
jgi:hypothetical protein